MPPTAVSVAEAVPDGSNQAARVIPMPRARSSEDTADPGPYDQLRAGRAYDVPRPFDVRSDGVWIVKYQRVKEDGKERWEEIGRARIATAPVLPTRVLYAPDGEELIEVAWWHAKGERVVSEVVPRSVASVGRALVKALRPKGFPVTDTDGPKIEKYLSEIEAANVALLGTDAVARQLGWQHDGVFVAGNGTPRRVELSWPTEQRAALAAHHTRGTLAGWKSAALLAAPYPVPRAGIAASLSAALLEITEVPPFALDLHGTSSGGKTTTGMFACSAWANPVPGGGGILPWSSTRLVIQLRFALCNGVAVVLDESKNVRSEDVVKQVIYDLPMGEPGGRGGDTYSARITWSTVVISTGERSLLAFTADAGAGARVLSVGGAPFGRDGATSADAAKAVETAVKRHYGHAGPMFAAELTADRREGIRARHAELTAAHRRGSDIARRRAPQVALLQLAEEIGCEYGILPYSPLSTEAWSALLGANQAADDPAERALDVLRSLVARNPHRMYGPESMDAPAGGWIGARRVFDQRNVVALYPEPVRDELARQGFEVDAVKPFWIEKGWLTIDPKRPTWLVRRRLVKGETQARVFEFPADVFDGDDD